jgi:D-amino-acid dehydrogenase
VVLVDAAKPGRATAAGAGIICPWSAQVADPAWRALAYAAAREYPALTARLADLGETDVGYRQVGALALAEREEDGEQIRQALLASRATAPALTWKPGSASARWARTSGRCSDRCPGWTGWSSPPAWAPRG